MKYKSVIATARGGPDVLQVVENEMQPVAAGEARIRIIATPVTQDDIAVRRGNRPWLAEIPFTPGYSILGEVDEVGPDVSNVSEGDRVVALTNYGGYAEYINWPAEKLVHVPKSLDPFEAVVLVLNYLVAYQILHRVAKVKAGDTALVIGASGGCGTAFLQLGRLAGIKMYGLASAGKHGALRAYGAIPIDYCAQDFVNVLQDAEPDGIDFVFNGMFSDYVSQGLSVLRRGGLLVQYGAPQTKAQFRKFLGQFILTNLLPNGKRIAGYGTHRLGVELFEPDWTTLFNLLREGQIKPIITSKFPLVEAAKANELFESSQVVGNVVLVNQ